MRNKEKLILLLITGVLLLIIFLEPLRFVDNLFYDLNFAFFPIEAGNSVAVVAFDARSLATIGAWPWNRSKIAEVIDKIDGFHPRVIALDILLPRREGEAHNDRLASTLNRVKKCIVPFRATAFADQHTAFSSPIPEPLKQYRFLRLKNSDQLDRIHFYRITDFDLPDTLFSQYSRYSGFLNISTSNTSQKLREIIHVVRAGEEYFPSFGLSAVAAYYNLKPEQFILDGRAKVWLDDKSVPISTYAASALLNFRSQKKPIVTISALDVLNGSADAAMLHDKLIFLGMDDPAAGSDFFTTPVASQYAGVKVWATAAMDIFEKAWVKKGGGIFGILNWALALVLFPGLALIFSGLHKRIGVFVGTGLLVASLIIGFILFQHLHYFWNPAHHLFAWLFSLVWLAGRKTPVATQVIEPLKLEVADESAAESIQPPSEEALLATIPKTATAHHILNTMSGDVATTILKPGQIDETGKKRQDDKTAPGGKEPMDRDRLSDEHVLKFQQIGNSKIVKVLGSGGMADVYLIWNPRMEVYRAVKVLKPNQPEAFMERFETEIRISSKLDHPNIVHSYGVGEWHSLPYVEMEYINGASVEEIIRKCGPLTAEQTGIIAILVCRALDYAHNLKLSIYGKTYNGVVHRDLKPANILLSRIGRVKLTDFGIARPAAVSLHTQDTGNVVGTLPYLSPEQLDGHDIDAQADIYALGLTMYEMLTGKRAFQQKEVSALIRAKSLGKMDKPLSASAMVPKPLIDIVNRAIQTEKKQRYPDAATMMDDLEVFLRDRLDTPGYLHLQQLANSYWS
ncbi:CHASE2 domain-containing protein [candidate division KSB1 bacterium]|nr:CHASE2 domain-containing protein [candidate division KSB1 bacterium]